MSEQVVAAPDSAVNRQVRLAPLPATGGAAVMAGAGGGIES